MRLPETFKAKMLELLGNDEYEELMAALNGQRQYGLRINTMKVGLDEFVDMTPFGLEAVPWTDDGFYISGEDAPGRHPYYHAGLYYIQEPSAMLPGMVLEAAPGDRVLDICAAPGGKTVQIAADMKGSGLLVSNDINAERSKVLVKNIELYGIRNAVVLNESPDRMAENFEGYFDKVLIDAPCSGEGTFRKDEAAARSWEKFQSERCNLLQEPILHYADRMLKPGGTLVYSTCTFSPEENEQMIASFMRDHAGYEFVEIPKVAGIEGGRPHWAATDSATALAGEILYDEFRKAARLWPHRVRGEGHFVAKLIKGKDGSSATVISTMSASANNVRTVPSDTNMMTVYDERTVANDANTRAVSDERIVPQERTVTRQRAVTHQRAVLKTEEIISYEKLPPEFLKFVKDNMTYLPDGVFIMKGRNLYHLPEAPPLLSGLKVAKFGWFLGSFEGDRFQPSHSLVTSLDMKAFKRTIDLSADSREVNSYLKGETLMLDGEKGLTAVCVDGKTLGWAKQTGDMLKNMYPKGWRRLS